MGEALNGDLLNKHRGKASVETRESQFLKQLQSEAQAGLNTVEHNRQWCGSDRVHAHDAPTPSRVHAQGTDDTPHSPRRRISGFNEKDDTLARAC